MNSAFAIFAVTLAALACTGQAQLPVLKVGRFRVGSGLITAFEDKVIAAMTAGKYTVSEVQLDNYQDRLDCLTGGTTKFPTPACDAVIAQFTITPDRQTKVTYVAPYYFGDGAGLKARTAAIANRVVASTNPAVAYAPYITGRVKTCIPTGSAYIPSATALGFTLTLKADEAAVVADPTCLLLITDSVAEVAPLIRVKGPVLPNTALPQGVAVQLKKAGQPAKALAIRASLTESAVALYQGVPGQTPLEKFNAVLNAAGLTSATAAIKKGALFIIKFFF